MTEPRQGSLSHEWQSLGNPQSLKWHLYTLKNVLLNLDDLRRTRGNARTLGWRLGMMPQHGGMSGELVGDGCNSTQRSG